jgi:arsenate reductase
MTKILIVCTGNSCRSQMAEAWIRKFSGNQIQVFSAGTHPEKVNPVAVKVMQIECVDISHHKSNLVDDFKDVDFNFVITVCDDANKKCPHFPSTAKKIHKSFPDPAKAKGTETEILKIYRDVRDSLKEFVIDFLEKELDVYVKKDTPF